MTEQQTLTDASAKQAAEAIILARLIMAGLQPTALPPGNVITAFRLSADGTALVHIFTGQKYTFTNEELLHEHERLHAAQAGARTTRHRATS